MGLQEIIKDKREIFVMVGLAIPFLLLFSVVPLDSKVMDVIEWRWIITAASGFVGYVFITQYRNKEQQKPQSHYPPHSPYQQRSQPPQPLYEQLPPDIRPPQQPPQRAPPKPRRDIVKEFDSIKKMGRK